MKTMLYVLVAIIAVSCGRDAMDKPKNLIEEDRMVDILTDLYIIEGIRQSNPASFAERRITPSEYVYKKYKIDSLQFVDSDHWYASDTERYRELYAKVLQNVEAEQEKYGIARTSKRDAATTAEPSRGSGMIAPVKGLPPKARERLRERNRELN